MRFIDEMFDGIYAASSFRSVEAAARAYLADHLTAGGLHSTDDALGYHALGFDETWDELDIERQAVALDEPTDRVPELRDLLESVWDDVPDVLREMGEQS